MPKELEDLLDELSVEVRAQKQRGGSRYVGAGAAADVIDHVAAGGSVKRGSGTPHDSDWTWGTKSASEGRTVEPGRGQTSSGRSGVEFAKALRDIAAHRTEHLTPLFESADHKALAEATDSAGGYLLTPELADSVLMLIRNRVAVAQMPVTHVTPRSKQYNLPGLSAGASASWLAENSSIPSSQETFSIVSSMTPHALGTLVAAGNRLLADATSDNPLAAESAGNVIQQDVANLMAVTQDAGFLTGTGTSPQPKGILNITGTTPLPAGTIGTNGSSPSYPILTAIVGALYQASMPFSSPGWIFNGRTLTSLMNLTNSTGEPLLSSAGLLTVDRSGSSGQLLGYPFRVTNAIPTNQSYGTAVNASTIIFSSDWSECFIGDWQQFLLDSSTEASYTPDGGTTWISAYQSQQTLFRATLWCDIAVRRPAAFVLAGGILP